ncbi:MAG: HEAT repeat domain-containing protein [Geobacteraceae bacterium]|nr:HEAT repeat domain-containing protein [Geobacteraceae bacterium]
MPEQIVAGPNETVEAPEVSKEEITLATEVMQAFVKTSKGFRMYLPNNPLLARFVEELNGKMGKHLSLYGDFRLDIDQFELRYKGKTVYENRDPKDSMAFKMYSDGIRFLIFNEGVEEHELCEFLEIVGKDRPSDLDDDIVTLLWEKNLPNISYVLAEDFLEFDSAGGGALSAESQQEKIHGIYRSIASSTPPAAPLLIPQKILVLTGEESDWLRKSREAEEKRKPLDEVIQIISAILVGEKDPEMFAEFVEIMAKLTESLANAGEIKYTFSLARFLANLARNENISPANRGKIDRSMGQIFSERTVKVLARILDTTELVAPEELLEFLHLFGRPAIGQICELLGLLEKMKMRKVVIQALIEIGHDAPETFFPFLADQRWYVVRNMVFILARLGTPAALDRLVALMSHKEPAVRREVLNYLERTPDGKAKTYILKFLRDESSAIRVRALQVLAGSRCTFALKPIAAIATSEQFSEKELQEKKAVFEAMGELGADQVLPLFREVLMKKYWFNKAKEKESVLCAVSGLLKVRSEAAVRLLEEARAVKGDEVREILTQALETMTAESGRNVTGP